MSITNTIACLFFNVYSSGLKQSDSDILTKLIAPPELILRNLKSYLNEFRLLSDKIRILPGFVINFGIAFDGGENCDNDRQTHGTPDQHWHGGGNHANWHEGCHAFQRDFVAGVKYPTIINYWMYLYSEHLDLKYLKLHKS